MTSSKIHRPGTHPATTRLRAHVAAFERLGAGDSPAAMYAKERIAAFEEHHNDWKLELGRWAQRDAERSKP